MKILHDWNVTPIEAIALQKKLASEIITYDCLADVHHVAGVDVALEGKDNIRAAIVIMKYPSLEIIEIVVHSEKMSMPYIPGLLSFREMPALLQAWAKIKQQPDLIFVDGMGIAHPRGIGIASHLGLWLQIPTIGVAKKKLVGTYDENALGNEQGSYVPLLHHNKTIGVVLRSRTKVKPLFVSLGHMISLETTVTFVLACCKGYRLIEPIRYADKLSKGQVLIIKK